MLHLFETISLFIHRCQQFVTADSYSSLEYIGFQLQTENSGNRYTPLSGTFCVDLSLTAPSTFSLFEEDEEENSSS